MTALRAVGAMVVGLAIGALGHAHDPAWSVVELQARANFNGAYNLPDGVFFNSQTPRVTDTESVAFRVGPLASTDYGLWVGGGGGGAVVYSAPVGAFLSGVTINNPGMVIFELTSTSPPGLYFYNTAGGASGPETNLPLGASGWGSPTVNTAGEIGYRASFSGNYAWVSYDGLSTADVHIADANLDFSSPYSYLFTPSFNDSRNIAGKVRLGPAGQVGESQPDEIRVFSNDGASVLIAEDQDSDALSPYTRFDNSVSLTGAGSVAFVATLASGDRAVVLSDGATDIVIGSEAMPDISEIEYFGPSANGQGLVAFRAKDGAGLRAIFAGDGTSLWRVIAEHDLVPTDLGEARIDQHDSNPVFGGSPSVNSDGSIAFNAGLTPPENNQVEWGSGIFVAYRNGTIFADGFESGDTTAWSAIEP